MRVIDTIRAIADLPADAGFAVAPAVWDGDGSGPDIVTDLEGDHDRADARGDRDWCAVGKGASSGVVGVHEGSTAVAALDHRRDVVQPGVVAAQVATADEFVIVAVHGSRQRISAARIVTIPSDQRITSIGNPNGEPDFPRVRTRCYG